MEVSQRSEFTHNMLSKLLYLDSIGFFGVQENFQCIDTFLNAVEITGLGTLP